jgi:hypothetical protein
MFWLSCFHIFSCWKGKIETAEVAKFRARQMHNLCRQAEFSLHKLWQHYETKFGWFSKASSMRSKPRLCRRDRLSHGFSLDKAALSFKQRSNKVINGHVAPWARDKLWIRNNPTNKPGFALTKHQYVIGFGVLNDKLRLRLLSLTSPNEAWQTWPYPAATWLPHTSTSPIWILFRKIFRIVSSWSFVEWFLLLKTEEHPVTSITRVIQRLLLKSAAFES